MYRRCTIYFDYYDISTCTEDVQNMYRRCTKYVQKMYNILGILIEVPDYSSSFFFLFQEMKRKLSPPEEKNIPLGNPRFPEASADVNSKHEWSVSQRKPEPRIFLSRTPAARKAVPSLT